MTKIKATAKPQQAPKAASKPAPPPAKGGKTPGAKGGTPPKAKDSHAAAPSQALMPRGLDLAGLRMPPMARDNTRVALPTFRDNKARSLPFALPGGLQVRALPAPRQTYLSQAPAPRPAPAKPKAPEAKGYHSKSEGYQHKAHYGVMIGEGFEWLAHNAGKVVKGAGHLGHQVAGKLAPALKVLGPVTGGWQVLNAFGTMMDPYASHGKAATQLTSGLIQMVPLGVFSGLVATGIEKMGPSDRQEALTRRSARAKDGVDFDGGYPQAACEYWVKELAMCGAGAHEARQLVDQWAERNDEYKQHLGIGRLYRNRPNDQEREAIVKAYLRHLKEGH